LSYPRFLKVKEKTSDESFALSAPLCLCEKKWEYSALVLMPLHDSVDRLAKKPYNTVNRRLP